MFFHFVFGNQSISATLIASVILFSVATIEYWWKALHAVLKILSIAFIAVLSCQLLMTNGRAGWIGLVTGLIFLLYRLGYIGHCRKTIFLYLAGLMIFCCSLFLFKKDSSSGRIIIYKVSSVIFKEHWADGIGLGNYKHQYNLYQARYFLDHDINGKEALLADNSFYAFNDYWQLLIEIGVFRFTILAVVAGILCCMQKQYPIRKERKYLFNGAASGLICILTASLFSNPLQFVGLQFLALTFLLIMLISLKNINASTNNQSLILQTGKAIISTSILILCCFSFQKWMIIKKSTKAFQISRAGYKTESLNIYQNLSNSIIKYGPTLLAYANQLYSAGKLSQAGNVIAELKKIYTNNEVYRLSAVIELESGNLRKAEEEFKTAMYMVPNRMRSRFDLLNFYTITKDTLKAKYWAHSILKMPVKIPSPTTDRIKYQTQVLLNQLEFSGLTKNPSILTFEATN